jgi:hypothetical protein
LGNSEPVFHAWWPSQFLAENSDLRILASYGEALPDSFSSDINVGDAEAAGMWRELERIYEINLDPKRLLGEPAVIEGTFGRGKVVLSLIHFDTPGDEPGQAVLRNLWSYLGVDKPDTRRPPAAAAATGGAYPVLEECAGAVTGLMELGYRNFLWFRRNSILTQWRRGVRGLEYCTLSVMITEVADAVRTGRVGREAIPVAGLEKVRELLLPFTEKAKQLLLAERFALQNGRLTYETCDDSSIQALRDDLFSRSKSYGGAFKTLLDAVDDLVFGVLDGSSV